MEGIRILTQMDNPPKILGFTAKDIVLVAVPFCMGFLLGGYLGFLVSCSGFFLRKWVKRIDRRCSKRFAAGLWYWYYPASKSKHSHKVPPAAIREYIL